jgi:hypothetical protein
MAKTIHNGAYLYAAGGAGGISNPVHAAAGRLIALLISHAQSTVQSVIFYDDTAATGGTEILVVNVAPEASPFYVQFPRDAAIPFDTGLHIAQGNCDVAVWSVDHG